MPLGRYCGPYDFQLVDPLLFPFPPSLLRALGQLTGRSEQIGRLTGSLQVDISRIKSELGWRRKSVV